MVSPSSGSVLVSVTMTVPFGGRDQSLKCITSGQSDTGQSDSCTSNVVTYNLTSNSSIVLVG